MPLGYLITTALAAACTLLAVAPPRAAASSPSNLAYRLGFLPNEAPALLACYLVAATGLAAAEGDLGSTAGAAALALAALALAGLAVVARRGLGARAAVEDRPEQGGGPAAGRARDGDPGVRG